jgi:ATP-dependent Clp protease protease subunit
MTDGYILGVRSGDEPTRPSGQPSWGDGPANWDDWMRSSFHDRRTVLVGAPLDDAEAGRVAAALLLLDASGDEPVELRIDSDRGTLGAALTLVDVVDLLRVPVRATCVGRAEGAAFAVLAVADHRAVVPHARLRIEDDPVHAEGDATEVVRFAGQRREQLRQLCDRLADASHVDASEVRSMLERRQVLAVDEARRLGFVDEILDAPPRASRYPSRTPFGRR